MQGAAGEVPVDLMICQLCPGKHKLDLATLDLGNYPNFHVISNGTQLGIIYSYRG
jgi:hypothetical protein